MSKTAEAELVALTDGSLWMDRDFVVALCEARAHRPTLTVSQAAALLERWRTEDK